MLYRNRREEKRENNRAQRSTANPFIQLHFTEAILQLKIASTAVDLQRITCHYATLPWCKISYEQLEMTSYQLFQNLA